MSRAFRLGCAAALVVLMTGCGGSALPTFDEARDATHVEMQKIVDRLPEGAVVRVDDPRPDSRYSCDGGVSYTGQWHVYVADGFEIQQWISEVKPELLEDGYLEEDLDPSLVRSFSVRTPGDRLLIGVDNDEHAEEGARILVSGFSRCAQDPNQEGASR